MASNVFNVTEWKGGGDPSSSSSVRGASARLRTSPQSVRSAMVGSVSERPDGGPGPVGGDPAACRAVPGIGAGRDEELLAPGTVAGGPGGGSLGSAGSGSGRPDDEPTLRGAVRSGGCSSARPEPPSAACGARRRDRWTYQVPPPVAARQAHVVIRVDPPAMNAHGHVRYRDWLLALKAYDGHEASP